MGIETQSNEYPSDKFIIHTEGYQPKPSEFPHEKNVIQPKSEREKILESENEQLKKEIAELKNKLSQISTILGVESISNEESLENKIFDTTNAILDLAKNEENMEKMDAGTFSTQHELDDPHIPITSLINVGGFDKPNLDQLNHEQSHFESAYSGLKNGTKKFILVGNPNGEENLYIVNK